MAWGAAVDPDIIRASIDALVTAINNLVNNMKLTCKTAVVCGRVNCKNCDIRRKVGEMLIK